MNDGTMQPMMVPGQDTQPMPAMPPVQSAQPAMAGAAPQNNTAQGQAMPQMQPVMGPNGQPLVGPDGMPVMQAAPVVQVSKDDNSGLIKTIVIIVLALMSVAFIGLFVWKQSEFATVQEDVEGQISQAVDKAKYEQQQEDAAKYAEEEKNPWQSFVGPVDYGQLSFKYPKTWSLYIAKDAARGGDYEAYFNPIAVEAVSNNTINALRLTILDQPFESVVASYQGAVQGANAQLSVESIIVNNINMNKYVGLIPGTELRGIIVVFKIRDKTVVMRTDSEDFAGDFDALLQTITFNE